MVAEVGLRPKQDQKRNRFLKSSQKSCALLLITYLSNYFLEPGEARKVQLNYIEKSNA